VTSACPLRPRLRPAIVLFVLLGAALLVFAATDNLFHMRLFTRASILALAALALDFLVGVAGLVSLGQAAFLGVGAYAVAVLAEHGIHDGLVQGATALGASAVLALLFGALGLRTRGVHFIMITLAFAQMLYFIANSLSRYGGNDGVTIWVPSQLPGLGSLAEPATLACSAYAVLMIAYLGLLHLRGSRFGRVLLGAKENERRMLALGFDVRSHQLAAFVLSGTLTGLAGVLLANATEFVAPAYMSWHRSGELLAIVVLGGSGTLHGPIIGAFLFVLLEEMLSRFTTHWALIFGPFLVIAVLTERGRLVLERLRAGRLR
jgi:branched-chain amino acid transport system permease protein